MPKLILKFGAAVIKEINIEKEIITIGRKPDNDIVIDNPAVSGHHAKISKQGNSYFVEDLGSTNGTLVNGAKKLTKAAINNKDTITMATHSLVFVGDQPQASAQPGQKEKGSDETVIIAAAMQKDLLKGAGAAVKSTEQVEKVGALRIVEGIVDDTEIELPGLLIYVGTDSSAIVKIKGFFAPKIAAAIVRRPDGYIIKAVKEGYPKLNGASIKDQQKLNNGDTLEFGKTKMVFFEKEKK